MRLLLAALLLSGWQDPGVTLTGKVTVAEAAVPQIVFIRYDGPDKKLLRPPDPMLAVVWISDAPAVKFDPGVVEIRQSGLEFRPRVAAATAGSTLKLPNEDATQHNVFSLTPGKKFDVGKYPKGESQQYTFKGKGRIVDLSCHVHKHMRATLHLFDHPYFAVAKEDGSFTIPNVPPGEYTLNAWKEGFAEISRKIQVKAGGPAVDFQFTWLVVPEPRGEGTAPAGCCSGR